MSIFAGQLKVVYAQIDSRKLRVIVVLDFKFIRVTLYSQV